jgi:hypothetical protein
MHVWVLISLLQYKAELRIKICEAVLPVINILRHQNPDVRKAAASSLSELAKYCDSFPLRFCDIAHQFTQRSFRVSLILPFLNSLNFLKIEIVEFNR